MKINRRKGFTIIEIMIVVAITGVLAAIAIPNFVRSRTKAQQNACINILRQIDGAVQQWALEERKSGSDTVADTDITSYLGRNGGSLNNVVCPSDSSATPGFTTSYTLGTVGDAPECAAVGNTGDTPHVLD